MNLFIKNCDFSSETGFKTKKGGVGMENFEKLLNDNRKVIERFVKFKINSSADAQDVLQEVYIAAYQSFPTLKSEELFKPWLVGIAKKKCSDYFRRKYLLKEVSIDEITEKELSGNRHCSNAAIAVRETINLLSNNDKQILYLFFFEKLKQREIAQKLNIPLGTVKSRLHTAKKNFKESYPYTNLKAKGENSMKKLPKILPEYKIEKSELAPFGVKWEEIMGWFIVPKLGEKLTWAMYYMPERKIGETDTMEVIGKAEVHGVEGVEIKVKAKYPIEDDDEADRMFIAQLTDTHCRILSESHVQSGVRKIYTFLDGDDFLANWGFGEDNCGNETSLTAKGDIQRDGNIITSKEKDFLLDIVGRYTVAIGGKEYDTVCVMDIENYNGGVVTEQFLDKNGRTILWRRFNRNDWAFKRYQKLWTEILPESETITVNGITYVHWYDCITDYIL